MAAASTQPGPRGAARIHYRLARALAWWGLREAALQAISDALQRDPELGEAHFLAGEVYVARAQWILAARSFAEAARLRPWDAEVQGNVVLSLWRGERWQDCAEALDRMIRLRPAEAELYILSGEVQRRLQRRPEAIRSFRWAVRIAQPVSSQRCFLGPALLGREKWDSLVASFDAACAVTTRAPEERVPSPLGARRHRRPAAPAWWRRVQRVFAGGLAAMACLSGAAASAASSGALELRRRCLDARAEEAVAWCARALQGGLEARSAVVVRQALAEALVELARFEEAVAVYREAARLRPADAEAQLKLGTALLHLSDRTEEAMAVLQETIRLDAHEPRAYAELGLALHRLGHHPEAVAAFAEAERLRPDYFDHRPAARETYEASKRGQSWP